MLIVCEGLAGAGKTTALTRLQAGYGYNVIPEIIGKEPLRAEESFYIKNDVKKYRLSQGCAFSLMDRNFVSTLAYNYAKDKITGTNRYPFVKNLLERHLRTNTLSQPDAYLFFDCSPEASLRRQSAGNRGLWNNGTFLEHARAYYETYFNQVDAEVITIPTEAINDRTILKIAEYVKAAKHKNNSKQPVYKGV